MIMNREDIQQIIPHRPPFLLIDQVIEMVEGESIIAKKFVQEEEYYFEGHFPQEKVMPGVLIVESLAQAGAVAILSMEKNRGKIAYFGGIKAAKFRQKVVPGDVLTLHLTIQRLRDRAGTGIGKAYRDDQLVCECEILFAIGTNKE
ncbi:MAG: 3-hydroxyacyl-ACP dehydratase FabZ [Anaerovoracaceae bacterium]